jgi:hypothetical protein
MGSVVVPLTNSIDVEESTGAVCRLNILFVAYSWRWIARRWCNAYSQLWVNVLFCCCPCVFCCVPDRALSRAVVRTPYKTLPDG